MRFTIGQRVRFEAEFLGADGKLFDPEKLTATLTITRPDGTATSQTQTLGNGIERKRRGLFFAMITMTEVGQLVVRFDAGKDDGFSQITGEVYDPTASGAEDQIAAEESRADVEDEEPAGDLEDLGDGSPAPRLDTAQMIEFLKGRGVPVDTTRPPEYIESLFTAYGGGASTRADVSSIHTEIAVEDLKRVIAAGKSPGELYAEDRHRQLVAKAHASLPGHRRR